MKLWPLRRKADQKIAALEEEVRVERGQLAHSLVKFEREDNALDVLVRQHLALLRGNDGQAPH